MIQRKLLGNAEEGKNYYVLDYFNGVIINYVGYFNRDVIDCVECFNEIVIDWVGWVGGQNYWVLYYVDWVGLNEFIFQMNWNKPR